MVRTAKSAPYLGNVGYYLPTGTDRYGRTLARFYVNGVDVGRYLVARNLARLWRK